jgi:hypothetical protein
MSADLFEPEATYTSAQKLAAVEREIHFRRRVYDRRVAEGKMKRDKADFEIAIFEDIAKDYREKVRAVTR